MKIGRLEVIRGCMFSGKTEELIRRLTRLKYTKQTYLAFKPFTDKRYSEDEIVSHNGITIPACVVINSEEIYEVIRKQGKVDVIAIDEVQFFDSGIVDVAQRLIFKGCRIIAAGLDTDFRGKPFGPMGNLLAIADEDVHLYAICTVCGRPAVRTQRLIDGKPAKWNEPTILLGAQDRYEARCREHHIVLGKYNQEIAELISNALEVDGKHHKQWYLCKIADKLGIEVSDELREKAIAP